MHKLTPEQVAAALKGHPGYYYLGSPYSKYPHGTGEAFVDVCQIAAELIRDGVSVYSPIAHSHPISLYGGLDALDHGLWLSFDERLMACAEGLIVACMDGWGDSIGLTYEIEFFEKAGKRVIHMECDPAVVAGLRW